MNTATRTVRFLLICESILQGAYRVRPITIDAIRELQDLGGIFVPIHLSEKSKRFPELQALFSSEMDYSQRSAVFKSRISSIFWDQLSSQLTQARSAKLSENFSQAQPTQTVDVRNALGASAGSPPPATKLADDKDIWQSLKPSNNNKGSIADLARNIAALSAQFSK